MPGKGTGTGRAKKGARRASQRALADLPERSVAKRRASLVKGGIVSRAGYTQGCAGSADPAPSPPAPNYTTSGGCQTFIP